MSSTERSAAMPESLMVSMHTASKPSACASAPASKIARSISVQSCGLMNEVGPAFTGRKWNSLCGSSLTALSWFFRRATPASSRAKGTMTRILGIF
ncbi:MAG: hypothetical protein A3G81_26550 [Betaproteobacteria bacterium RIFCSPLOWO2_12_FULL_65_14]|nr:MAG: hypothetical protein A3G81_26550 [Betaproteobacteria bacterium RIFCSPLOWO2_12_FULL_65_14]